MKKIIAVSLLTSALFSSQAFADTAMTTTDVKPTSVITTPTAQEVISQKYDVILRNNKIVADYEYNNVHYYTKKITTKDIVIPDEVKNKASKVYFLVEEGYQYMYYKGEAMMADAVEVEPVTKEYNYKVVAFTPGKEEYIFNAADLVKDFDKDTYKNVTIHLVADMPNDEKVYLANSAYVGITNKENTLETLKSQKNENSMYYGYYDTQSLEKYLETLSEKLSREDYKKLLTNSQTKLKSLIKKNDASKKDILASIKQESDFEGNVDKYALYTETNSLLNNVFSATTQQIQKIRSYDMIDSVFGK